MKSTRSIMLHKNDNGEDCFEMMHKVQLRLEADGEDAEDVEDYIELVRDQLKNMAEGHELTRTQTGEIGTGQA